MVAAMAPIERQHNKRFQVLTETVVDEKPVAMQIYGREPEWCAETARALDARGADIIDLNCGCPVRKAKNAGCGVALMKEPGASGPHCAGDSRCYRQAGRGENASRF